MLQSEEREAYFASAGEDGVRAMLQAERMMPAGSDTTAVPSIADAWAWLDRKRAEREAATAKKEAVRDHWMKVGVLLSFAAAVLAGLSWLFPLKTG